MSNFLQDLVTELGTEFASIASDGESAAQISGFIDTGCYLLNAVVSGSIYKGIPANKITAIAGEEATGKTFVALGICKSHLDKDSKATVIYFDTEAAVTKEMLEDRDIDSKRVMIVQPKTIQQFRVQALKILDAYEAQTKKYPMIMVLDSLGMMSTTKEIEDTADGKETRDMTKAQVLKGTFRVLTLRLATADVPLIVTNHVYDVIGSYVPMQEMGGGSGLKYSASSIIFLASSKDKDGTDVVGNFIKVKMNKSRLTKPNTVVKLKLSYQTGLDKYYGLLELAEKYDIIKKVTAQSYQLSNGTKVKGSDIRNNPEKYYTKEVLDQIDEAAQKEFMYGNMGDTRHGDGSETSEDNADAA